MTAFTFNEVRGVLRNLSLREVDLEAGDAKVERLVDLKRVIEAVETDGEPWVTEWLLDEHGKGAILHTAALMNWNKEQSDGPGSTFNARSRGAIIRRFNEWVSEVESRFEAYEHSGRGRADVGPWRAALARFREDPVRNR